LHSSNHFVTKLLNRSRSQGVSDGPEVVRKNFRGGSSSPCFPTVHAYGATKFIFAFYRQQNTK